MLISNVRIAEQRNLVDVRCSGWRIAELGPSLERRSGETVVDGRGAALLPGLHDHHIHLYALAAAQQSVQCGPPAVASREQLTSVLRGESGPGWLRGVGYHESVAGDLDRWQLDRMVSDRPVKLQHRSGKLWIVNSSAARLLSLDENAGRAGVELDDGGRPNGRLFRLDNWMRAQLAGGDSPGRPSLAATSRMLASCGVTGVTDATPDNDHLAMAAFTRAVQRGELLQSVRVMGDEELPRSGCDRVQRGERKVMLDEHDLPAWDELVQRFAVAHRQGRGVAVHCVTPAELVLALSALREVGARPGDRVEHASLVPTAVLPLLRESGVRVVTQPGFIYERGDRYRRDIDVAQHPDLYRCRKLLAGDIRVGGSTDAPYGAPDPWRAMRAAVHRQTRSGVALGREECLSPEQALALFTCAGDDPGGTPRRIAVGEDADLCLLDRPWEEARRRLCREDVLATLIAGQLVYYRDHQVRRRRQCDHVAA